MINMRFCRKSKKPVFEVCGYCEDCEHDTEERESKLCCDTWEE